MDSIIFFGVAVQAVLLVLVAIRLRQRSLGAIGFLLMAATFVYHGLTEMAQAIFPGRDLYRDLAAPSWVAIWTLLISAGLALFTVAYLSGLKAMLKKKPSNLRLADLIANLDRAYLLRWPLLLGIGIPSFLFVLVRTQENDTPGGYWLSGLAVQFTPLLLTLSFATVCIKTGGRRFLLIFLGFSIFLIASGNRFDVLATALLAISAMIRYGVKLPKSTLFIAAVTLVGAVTAISASRGTYGRFRAGEGFVTRLEAIGSTILSPENISTDELLDDSIYRFDGNSFGAMILERQSDGYGITGLKQAEATVGYMIPSFIYRGKLNLDEYLRNEEGYAVEFYGLPPIDYMSDFWTILLCYAGPWGLLICALILGWICACLDNWLSRTSDVLPYLIGLGLSEIPANLEVGFLASILDTFRALVVLVPLVWLLSRRKNRTQGSDVPNVARELRLPQHT
jgi:hypothetical protein